MDKALDWQSGVVSLSCVGGKMKLVDVRREMNQEGGLYMEE